MGIPGDVDRKWRTPEHVFALRAGLQEHKVGAASEMSGHLDEDFPVEALLIETDAAPVRHVLKNLERDGIDSALRFPRTGAPGD